MGLVEGAAVGLLDGACVGCAVGDVVGATDGEELGLVVGLAVGLELKHVVAPGLWSMFQPCAQTAQTDKPLAAP